MSMTLQAGVWTVRPLGVADRDGIAEAGRDPEIQLMPGFGTNFQDDWAEPWVARAEAEWAAGQRWVFSINHADGHHAGAVEFTSGATEELEVSYWVLPRFRGQGAASSALGALIPWVRTQLRPARIVAKASDRNVASLRVLDKSGFARVHRKGEFVHFEWPGSAPQ